ncbi:NifU family protein [Candidatus Uabimicrobium sp. HlEnr_7]|uniref:NifU family protein n=1 Tax=Candidatus Uabimicrobium helgolandensis TaxID=3095367 RepID=UPI003558F84F
MSEKIAITCHPQMDPQICMFEVAYNIYTGQKYNFKTPEQAQGSPLIERLFSISGIDQVYVENNSLYVTKNTMDPWPQFAKKIGTEIRDCIANEKVLISTDLQAELPQGDLATRVQEVLDQHINPGLAMHGGSANLLEVKNNDVYVELSGGCQGCSMAMATLKNGIESTLKREIPTINAVYDQTDHTQGSNPYFS